MRFNSKILSAFRFLESIFFNTLDDRHDRLIVLFKLDVNSNLDEGILPVLAFIVCATGKKVNTFKKASR